MFLLRVRNSKFATLEAPFKCKTKLLKFVQILNQDRSEAQCSYKNKKKYAEFQASQGKRRGFSQL